MYQTKQGKLNEYNISLIGASTSVYANRIGGFAGAVKDYQAALMEYRQAVTTNSTLKTATKQKAYIVFQRMQRQFRNAITGSIAVNVGLSILMVATPVGWVGLIVGGLAVAGVAAASSIVVNNAIQQNSGDWCDAIMDVLGVK